MENSKSRRRTPCHAAKKIQPQRDLDKKEMKNIEKNTEKSHIAPVFDENDGDILKN
jgi:hypothetical protein